MAVSAAERARQKAEARRARILASADQRLDVVAGLQPAGGLPDEADEEEVVVAVSPVASPVSGEGATVVPADAEAASEPSAQSKGARRMAAMRKRRYKSKAAKEAEAGDVAKEEEPTTNADDPKPDDVDAEPAIVAEPAVVDTKVAKGVDSPEPAPAAEVKISEEEEMPSAAEDDKDDEKENQPSPSDEKKEDNDGPPKKYMGVARMRRKILKEQKAQRLKELDGAPELVAEVATMDVTASMVRAGGSPRLGESLTGSLTAKKGKRKWYANLVPPMKVIPRMVTLLLLFVAGLDLGTQPHRMPAPLSGGAGARNLVAGGHDGPRELVRRAEPSLTRPWEHGLGGRAARLVGMAPSAAPTALPAAFDDMSDKACATGEGTAAGEGACLSLDGGGKDKKPSKIKVQLMEDEFDSTRTRPKGVVSDEGSEFDDVDDDVAADHAPNNIDPLFQVDLDALLRNADLPLPLALAAQFAIGFHRTWVYCLWTWPVKMVKTMARLPGNVTSGWVANPPWILVVALAMKLVARVLLGDGASYHVDSDKSAAGRGADDGGGGGGKDMDVLGKGIDMAKNYVTSMFPRTTWALGTAMTVMKVDMYVVLCGMLVGLVGPLAREDYASWKGASGAGGGGTVLEGNRPPLGDEL